MKKTILTLIILSFMYSVKAQEKRDYWHIYRLKNKVKSFKQVIYKVTKDSTTFIKNEIDKKFSKLGVYSVVFNKEGNQIEKTYYKPSTNTGIKYTFDYDSAEKLIEYKSYNYKTKQLYSITNYKYNKNGQKTESKRFDHKKKLLFVNTYKYDKNGNQIENNTYNNKNDLIVKQTFLYDKNGNQTQKNEYDGENLSYKETYKYNKDGYKYIKVAFYDDQNNYNGKVKTMTYNEKNKLVEYCDYYSENILTYIQLYKYNDDGEIIEYKSKSFEPIEGLNVKEAKKKINFKNIATFKYSYDKHGNWVKTIKYENGIAKEIVKRAFEYFNP